jgi:hypothetical protein
MSRHLGHTFIGADLWLRPEFEVVTPSVRAAAPFAIQLQYGTQYSDTLWTRSRMISGDPGVSAGTEIMPITRFWWVIAPRGAGGWSRITGITKDSAGAVLGGCTVRLFRTADDVEVDQAVSDAGDGTYSVGVPTDDTYYCVAYLPGSPDVAGTTVNTLTGS